MAMGNRERGRRLPGLARRSLEAWFARRDELPVVDDPWLAEPGATFVTLFVAGRLHGCIGSVQAARPVAEDVWLNARAAAFHDPRFPALEAAELARLTIEVSLLSPFEEVPCRDASEAIAALRPRVHGALLEAQGHRGLFLPQVWASLPTPDEFLAGLLRKAGLPPDQWPRQARLSRFTVDHWHDDAPRRGAAPG